ncbi:MAG: cell division protein FtsQ/DivIB [Acutalibacteraceae bacterium]
MDREMQTGAQHRLTPEERALRVKNLKRKRRFRLAIVVTAFILLLCLIVSPIIIFAVFRVKTFNVEGASPYTSEQIISASGIQQGKSLIFADLDEAAASIEKTLPYTDNVKLTKKLPSGIIIRLEETSAGFAVEMSGGMYALTNSEMKVLELSGEVPEGAAVITGAVPVKAEAGSVISFSAEEEDKTLSLIKQITGSVAENGMEDINLIDVSEKNNIYLIYQGRIVMRLGDSSDLASKLSLGQRVISQENTIDPSQFGTVNLTVAKKAYFNPSDFNDISELVKYRENYVAEANGEAENDNSDSNEDDG